MPMKIPYRALNPHTEGPMVTGPTRDYKRIGESMPISYEEPFQIRPMAIPVKLAAKIARPETVATPVVQLRPSRVPVLIRTSNIRPSEAGQGLAGSVWGVSDPGFYHRRDAGMLSADDPAAPVDTTVTSVSTPTDAAAAPAPQGWSLASQVTTRLVLAGIAAGVAFYFIRKNMHKA